MLPNPNSFGFSFPRILVPNSRVDLKKWAVIACDQYTSEPLVWRGLETYIGDAPSTLHCILPECYLGADTEGSRISGIHQTMQNYLQQGLLQELDQGIMLVERTTPHSKRRGMVISLDLEQYDYRPGTKPLIRPTEETVVERLPPRVKIRQGAAIEFPHTLVLLNDRETRVIDTLFSKYAIGSPFYQTELALSGGSLTGWFVAASECASMLIELLQHSSEGAPFLYAVGDGNHSIAAAKLFWERVKPSLSAAEQANHPARYTLVELVSLYDPGVHFEPIHRILYPTKAAPFLDILRSLYSIEFHSCPTFSILKEKILASKIHAGILTEESYHTVEFLDSPFTTITETVQRAIDAYRKIDPAVTVDYIHGDAPILSLCKRDKSLGIYLPSLDRESLFPLIAKEGVLPRKAFSIGEAVEKRFYLEGRRIIPSW